MKEIILNESDMNMKDTYTNVVSEGEFNILESFAKILSYGGKDRVVSFVESAALDSMHKEISEKYNQNSNCNWDLDLPEFTPYYTPTEYRNLLPDKDISDFDYIIIQDPIMYRRALENLYRVMKNAADSEIIRRCQEKMTELGWMPQAEPTLANMGYARARQILWLKKNKPKLQFVDVRNFDGIEGVEETTSPKVTSIKSLEPIYICLSYTNTIFGNIINWWKKSKYSHSALSLDEKLDKMASFNRDLKTGEGGFFIEGIQDYKNPKTGDADLCVLGMFVTKEQKKKIKETIDWYQKNKRITNYSLKNIANIVFNRTTDSIYSVSMVCSQFVDNILKLANLDITKKSNNLVSPEDFLHVASENNKIYIVYQGLKSKYNPKAIKAKMDSILRFQSRNDVPKLTVEEVTASMIHPTLDSFLVECVENKDKQSILEDAIEILTPTSIIEAKRIPVGFTRKGDIYIDAKKDLEAEYQEAHKLLTVYDESNLQGIKHELARLFYVISIIDRRVGKINDRSSVEYKDLIKLKARAMNDFTKYMKIVNKEEKNFDFHEYLKHTEYYDKTMIIGNDTLKYSGNFIKKAIRLLNV